MEINRIGAICNFGTTCITGENLPSNARTMNFRVTVRDNRGGNADVGMTVTVVNTATPFKVTTLNTATSFTGGTNRIITWDVSATNVAPISTQNVKISLSTDGGQTFPTVLAASTPNDGTESVAIPNTPTTLARIKVEAVDNIFFDINDANATITPAPTASFASVSGTVNASQGFGKGRVTVPLTDSQGNDARTVLLGKGNQFRFRDVMVGQTYILSVSARGAAYAPQVITVNEDISGVNFEPID